MTPRIRLLALAAFAGIRLGGELYCWGSNGYGQLGDGGFVTRTAPRRIGTFADWTAIFSGGRHTCALRSGTLYCWGYNGNGELGIGNFTTANTRNPAAMALTPLTGAGSTADGDELPIVDVSDTTMAASGTTKAISMADLAVGVHNINARQIDVTGASSTLSGNLVLTIAQPVVSGGAGSPAAPSAPVLASSSDTGPTQGATRMPNSCAARTTDEPGSATAGMPASLTKPTSWPAKAALSRGLASNSPVWSPFLCTSRGSSVMVFS